VFIRVQLQVIEAEKGDRTRKRGSLVSVEESMIAADAVEIRGRHLEQRLMQVFARESRFYVPHDGLQQI
jgi:hypothetical protein